jgi:hypothetical protein
LHRLEASEEQSLLQNEVIALVETWKLNEASLTGGFTKYSLIQSPEEREKEE